MIACRRTRGWPCGSSSLAIPPKETPLAGGLVMCESCCRFCQYTFAQLARFAREHNLARSVGRTAVCWDDAQAESFWATLKAAFYDGYLWPTKVAAKLAVGDWIERVYNRRRRHAALAVMRPVEFEDRLAQTAQAA